MERLLRRGSGYLACSSLYESRWDTSQRSPEAFDREYDCPIAEIAMVGLSIEKTSECIPIL